MGLLYRPAGQTNSLYLKPWPFSLYILAASEFDEGLVFISFKQSKVIDLVLYHPVSVYFDVPSRIEPMKNHHFKLFKNFIHQTIKCANDCAAEAYSILYHIKFTFTTFNIRI